MFLDSEKWSFESGFLLTKNHPQNVTQKAQKTHHVRIIFW